MSFVVVLETTSSQILIPRPQQLTVPANPSHDIRAEFTLT